MIYLHKKYDKVIIHAYYIFAANGIVSSLIPVAKMVTCLSNSKFSGLLLLCASKLLYNSVYYLRILKLNHFLVFATFSLENTMKTNL